MGRPMVHTSFLPFPVVVSRDPGVKWDKVYSEVTHDGRDTPHQLIFTEALSLHKSPDPLNLLLSEIEFIHWSAVRFRSG